MAIREEYHDYRYIAEFTRWKLATKTKRPAVIARTLESMKLGQIESDDWNIVHNLVIVPSVPKVFIGGMSFDDTLTIMPNGKHSCHCSDDELRESADWYVQLGLMSELPDSHFLMSEEAAAHCTSSAVSESSRAEMRAIGSALNFNERELSKQIVEPAIALVSKQEKTHH
jgi:hypothetical protein